MLAQLVSANQAVLLSTQSTLYLFYQGQVYKQKGVGFPHIPTHRWDEDFTMWTLIDSDTLTQPPIIGHGSDIWPIQVSPPNPSWWKSWSKQREAALLGMSLWDMKELMEGYVLAGSCLTEDLF